MQVEFTGRQIAITKKLRAEAQGRIDSIGRILGRTVSIHIVLTSEKIRHIAEITAATRQCNIAAKCEAGAMDAALQGALEKVEKQAVRHKDRIRAMKRQPKEDKSVAEIPVNSARRSAKANGHSKTADSVKQPKPSIPVVVHSFPSNQEIHEPHIVRTVDSVALRPMTIEEAVKEAEFRDREVFLFRNHQGTLLVLHRKRDGKMELIEAPI